MVKCRSIESARPGWISVANAVCGAVSMRLVSFLAELWTFMRVRKKFWLLPILMMTAVFGGLVVLGKGSAIAPFIYTLF